MSELAEQSLFSIANKFFRLKKYNAALSLYSYLQKIPQVHPIIYKQYEFNKLLVKKTISNDEFNSIANKTIDDITQYILVLLKENGYNNQANKILKSIEKIKTFKNDLYISSLFNKKLYAQRNKIKNEDDAFSHYINFFGEITDSTSLFSPIVDLKKKLWGGFSQETLKVLTGVLKSKLYDDKSKAEAAFLLGRWYTLQEAWSEAIYYIKCISKYDIKLFRSKRVKLLLIDCMNYEGDLDKSREMIDFVLSSSVDNDFICAKSNLFCALGKLKSSQERLELLNTIYTNNQLINIKLLDENNGYIFGNFKFENLKDLVVNGPKVSILMPVYNAGKFIETAVKSILFQTWNNIEIIAVEDCGTDDSWDKLQALAKQDSRLNIYRNSKNMGAYPTRNRALGLATGDYITVHDSDDWSHPQMIEVQMKTLLASDAVKATCSAMVRVYPNLLFILRPQRENFEHIHRSYPSILMRRIDLMKLGKWDDVVANADDEFVQRARLMYGNDAIVDVLPDVPLSFFLVHENSLTQQKATSLNSLTFGIRKYYATQADFWRRKIFCNTDSIGTFERIDLKTPFPIPQGLAPKHWTKNCIYDIVIISDLSLLGGTRRCNEGYIEAATQLGLRVGLFHWPRFDLKIVDIDEEYLKLSYQKNVDILVPEDEIICSTVIIHHPPILKYKIDAIPKIKTDSIYILVNQLPMQRWSREPHYYFQENVNNLCLDFFGKIPIWISISQRVKNILENFCGYNNIFQDIWYPPISYKADDQVVDLPKDFGSARRIVVGRHSRNHWTKWSSNKEILSNAYCVDSTKIDVRLLGGADSAIGILGKTPKNWTILEFDSIPVKKFIIDLDFFIHFVHEDYIEEFGRNVVEAMAYRRVVILQEGFEDIFGDAAVYCNPEEVESVCFKFWNNREMYKKQTDKGAAFVSNFCSIDIVATRLKNILKKL
jgi:glycosyltransferase involved in cell wall biosynthesis